MSSVTTSRAERAPLTRDRIVTAAVALADQHGLDVLTMRRLGAELGFEAMALYKHVPNKDTILAAITDAVLDEIGLGDPSLDWQNLLREQARSALETFRRHPWALGLVERQREPTERTLLRLDRLLTVLRGAGFPIADAAHALWAVDAFVYGHAIQEQNLPFTSSADATAADPAVFDALRQSGLSALAELAEHSAATDVRTDDEFTFGLDIVLNGLAERLRTARLAP